MSHKYDITKADMRTSDGKTAKIIPSREYWALVARAEKSEAELSDVKQENDELHGALTDAYYLGKPIMENEIKDLKSEVERLREGLKRALGSACNRCNDFHYCQGKTKSCGTAEMIRRFNINIK